MAVIKENELIKEFYGVLGCKLAAVKEEDKVDILLDCLNNPVNPDLQIKSGLSEDFEEQLNDSLGLSKDELLEISERIRPAFAFNNFAHAIYVATSLVRTPLEFLAAVCLINKHFIGSQAIEQAMEFAKSMKEKYN